MIETTQVSTKEILKHIIDYEYFLKDTAKEIYSNYNNTIALEFLRECLENPITPKYWSQEIINIIKGHING